MTRTIHKGHGLRGELRMPGDKSIAHRALIFGAMAAGEQHVTGLPPSGDVASTASCLRALGCRIETLEDGQVVVSGRNRLPAGAGARIDAGNSGTSARLLAGLAAGWGLDVTIDGDASLRRRPMTRVAEPLAAMGAEVRTTDGRLPLRIRGADLHGVTWEPRAASAQVKSAILIAGLYAGGTTMVRERAATRDHTERMLAAMGAPIERDGLAVTVRGRGRNEVGLRALDIAVPGDISSAAFFLVAASIVPGAQVRIAGTGVNPTRTGILDVLAAMGARVELERASTQGGEPVADIVVSSAGLRGVEIAGALVPRLIDELPVLAVAASQAVGTTVVRDAGELRHKESDRIRSVVESLTAMGADITEREDGFEVRGPRQLRGAQIAACGDHRIVMAMAVAGLVAEGTTTIEGSEAAGISYPSFFEDLDRLRV
jgi:3-phosphoshikimate 1-carboxyvinyltransferase